ncbi:MAG: ATP-binding cassette domain-containing protein [Stappiaceae bacterium]
MTEKSINTSGSNEPQNPVHQQLSNLAEQLGLQLEDTLAGTKKSGSAAENCLMPLLQALEWHGVERHLFEALPHFDQIISLHDLRAVLTRLNFDTTKAAHGLSKLSDDHFPAVYQQGSELFVCLSRERDGSIRALCGSTQQPVFLSRREQKRGSVYLIAPLDVQSERDVMRRHGWFSILFKKFSPVLFLIFCVGLLLNLMALALPIYVMTVYDKAIGAKAPDVLVTLTIGICIILTIEIALKGIKGRMQAYFGARLDNIVGNATFSQLLHLPLSLTGSAPIGAQITRLRQFESVRDVFTGSLANALIDLPFSIIFIVALYIVGGPIALLPGALLLVYCGIATIAIPVTKRAISASGEAKSKLQNLTIETLSQQRTIRDLSAEGIWIERYRNLCADFAVKNMKARQVGQSLQAISQMIMTICGVAVLGLGTIRVLEGNMTHGALIAVMALAWRVLNPMNQAFLSLTRIGQVQQTIQQINALMRMPVEREPGELPSVYRKFDGNLMLKSIVLRYPGRQEPALRGVDLSIKKGEVVAITGPSGSGKSSIIQVLLGLYPPQGGAVLADGLDVRQLNSGEWRHAVGYAPEAPDFFYGTVAQNLRMADPQASDEDLKQAANEVGLLTNMDMLPEGLETRLTGTLLKRLPDTVKQRIILARAFIKQNAIYMLDNPGNNLDFAGDQFLMNKIKSLKGKSTVVIVTQRPSHMRLADRVIYMSGGQIALQGPPEEVVPKIMNAA